MQRIEFKTFFDNIETFDQLRYFINTSIKLPSDRKNILASLVGHHLVFKKLINDSDALIQATLLFSTPDESTMLIDKVISNRTLFNLLIPDLESLEQIK